jgi:hypothetical protein
VDDAIRELKEQVKILRHLRKHMEKTVVNREGALPTDRKAGRRQAGDGDTSGS